MPRLGCWSGNANGASAGRRSRLRWFGGTCRLSACLGLALWALIAPAGPSAAEEATTAPTCTGCSRPGVAKKAKPRKSVRAAPRAAARSAGNRAGVNNDGAWAGVSRGPCIVTWNWAIDVSNGAVSGRKVTGQVARSGTIRGVMVVFSKSYKFTGHMNGATGSGTWTSAECSGSWTATKS